MEIYGSVSFQSSISTYGSVTFQSSVKLVIEIYGSVSEAGELGLILKILIVLTLFSGNKNIKNFFLQIIINKYL